MRRRLSWTEIAANDAASMDDAALGITPEMRERYRKRQALRLKLQAERDARDEAIGIITNS